MKEKIYEKSRSWLHDLMLMWLFRNKKKDGVAIFRLLDRGPFEFKKYVEDFYRFLREVKNPPEDNLRGGLIMLRVFNIGFPKNPGEYESIEVFFDKRKTSVADIQQWLTSLGLLVEFDREE